MAAALAHISEVSFLNCAQSSLAHRNGLPLTFKTNDVCNGSNKYRQQEAITILSKHLNLFRMVSTFSNISTFHHYTPICFFERGKRSFFLDCWRISYKCNRMYRTYKSNKIYLLKPQKALKRMEILQIINQSVANFMQFKRQTKTKRWSQCPRSNKLFIVSKKWHEFESNMNGISIANMKNDTQRMASTICATAYE